MAENGRMGIEGCYKEGWMRGNSKLKKNELVDKRFANIEPEVGIRKMTTNLKKLGYACLGIK